MSKFIDRLCQVSQTAVQPMGFRTGAGGAPGPKLLLVAAVAKADGVAEYVAGADAGLADVGELGSGGLKKVLEAVPDIRWGGWVKNVTSEKAGQLAEGCDFVVFPESMAVAAFQGEVGKVLAVEPSAGDGLVRALEKLPMDAVLLGFEPETGLTWQDLAQVQRFANLLAKPLLVLVPPGVGAAELQALLGAGVSGVVVEAGQRGRVTELRKAIDGLVVPPQRWRKRPAAIVPLVGGGEMEAAEEPDEEEED